ncbi:MAG TPA: RNA polymerase sigma factor RpoH [Paenalcaligenes sp.]|nr:RNA polymerase sigma factor RpoH [Paenalcaligenes sp.]
MTQSSQNMAIAPAQSLAVAVSNPGALGTIEAYIAAVNQQPILSADEERELGRRLQAHDDLDAARRLIMSHLRLVVSTARQYLGYGLPHADLIQEGNIGLMKAVRRFDPERGVRLVSFAIHWIKAEIHEYIIRNWRLVRIATTKAQRKLFFNLRRLRPEHMETLEPDEIEKIARELDVRPEDVSEMEVRMSGGEFAFETPVDDEDDEFFAPVTYLSDEGASEPTNMLEQAHQMQLQGPGLEHAIEQLDERSQRIIRARWLHDGRGLTLHELGDEFGVSAERIRQIEAAALKKMRGFLQQDATV